MARLKSGLGRRFSRRTWIVLILAVGTTVRCSPVSRSAAPPAPVFPAAENSLAAPAELAATRAEFLRDVRPILEKRCACHFEGGPMHQRLPFDQESVVRSNGSRILSRIKRPEDLAIFHSFFGEQK